ncbi:alpha/beta hydrolase [Mycobacterium sp. M1]|uniref:Alpha/beta hydrolase n=1 Tax=Mycolicibacter acidiphilus TaxID=2835306 RepID=A0ABS5RK02_9MYCO|nr:alpha/beta hydrolase [Mycolicibacter acidiphilus]MBS9534372.1 alpha/beta hydrolase [Mycolicibacter acidiphilus]
MTVSVSTVKASRPSTLIDAAGDMSGKISQLETVIAGEREDLARLQQSWQGDAAGAGLNKGLQLIGKEERFLTRLRALESALENGGDQLSALRRAIVEMVETLAKLGFSVSDAGVVEPHQWLIGKYLQSIAEKATQLLQKLLQLFDDVDQATAAAIDQARGSSIPNPPVKVGGDEIAIPSPDTSPEDVKRWWDSLTDDQRQELIRQHPALLGNLAGIPADVRDPVNVAVMDDDLDRVEHLAQQRGVSVDDVVNNPAKYGLSDADITRYHNAQKTQEGLLHDMGIDTSKDHRRYSEISDEEKKDLRPTMLWAYDPLAINGKGKAAIAIGNPDKSPNTAVIVPGTGSSVRDGWLSDGHNDAINLYDQSSFADPSHPTAVIAWMGYDTPASFTDPNIANPGLARTGGDLLAWDVNSLSATHESGVPQHVTVIGHSYGSTTVADAFANSGMQANDAVLLGCPGTDLAKNAADFHLNGGQVYVGDASTDPVGWIGEGHSWTNPLNDALGHPLGTSAGLGTDPAHDGFGATRFRAEIPDANGLNPGDHSHYYEVGGEALRGMTDIATGHGADLANDGMLAAPRTDAPILGTGSVHTPFGDRPVPTLQSPIQDPEADRPGTSGHEF